MTHLVAISCLGALALWCLIAGIRDLRARARIKQRLQHIRGAMGGG